MKPSNVFVGLFATIWSALAVAGPSFALPSDYTKQSKGAETYLARAHALASTQTVSAQAYRSPTHEVELVDVEWTFKPEGALTRTHLAQFDRDLILGTHVSDTREFEGDQLVSETFDNADHNRVYHRKLYRIDPQSVVHLSWLICTGPATQIGDCEQAQRTMKVEVSDAVTLPLEPVVPPPAQAPWMVTVPSGYLEIHAAAVDATVKMIKNLDSTLYTGGHAYVSPNHAVRLLVLMTEVYDAEAATSDDFEEYERHVLSGLVDAGSKHISDSHHAIGHQLAVTSLDEKDGKLMHWRRLYGVDVSHIVHAFSIVCAGPEPELAECFAAQREARLVLEEPPPRAPTPPRRIRWAWWSFLGVLVAGAAIWVITTARSSGRRRRR